MEKNRIRRFNENSELNISDVSESNKNEYFDVKYILELVRNKTITLDEGVKRIIQYYSH